MGIKGRLEYLRAIYERYRTAGRKSKKVILSEFCANTGYNRKYAIRLLNVPRPEKRRRPPRRRGLSYGQETLSLDRSSVLSPGGIHPSGATLLDQTTGKFPDRRPAPIAAAYPAPPRYARPAIPASAPDASAIMRDSSVRPDGAPQPPAAPDQQTALHFRD